MITARFNDIEVVGIACCVPANVTNIDGYSAKFGEKRVQKFVKMTGITEKHDAPEWQTAGDLAFIAAENLLREKNIARGKIGALVFVTETPDYQTPSTAFVLQHRLDFSDDCICFDINLGCSGFAPGMMTAASILKQSDTDYAMLLLGDTISRKFSPEDKSSYMLFGDGSSAILLHKQKTAEGISIAIESDGRKYPFAIIKGGGSRHPDIDPTRELMEDDNVRGPYDFYMDGTNVFSFTNSDIVPFIHQYLEVEGKELKNYDAIILHQANLFIIKTIAKKLKCDMAKVPISIDRYGNTTCASIPITICDAFGDKNEQTAHKLFCCGFGSGFSWGIVDMTVNDNCILPILMSDDGYED